MLITTELEEQAEEDIQFVLDIRPMDLQANYHKALLLARDGKMEEANLAMRRVSKSLDSLGSQYIFQNPEALFLYGLIKFQEGDYKET